MEEKDALQLIENIIKALQSLIEHAESLKQSNGLEEGTELILNLVEELGMKQGIIVESPMGSSWSGDSSSH